MLIFDTNKIGALKEFLYSSCIHDAKLEIVEYEAGKNELIIKVFNSIDKVKMSLTFCDVEIAFAIKGKDHGNGDTILSLTVEDDLSYLQKYIKRCDASIVSSLYILFQMFSGTELHIVSRWLMVEITK